MVVSECPCRYCVPPKRSATCHSTCKDYIDWTVEHKQYKDKIAEAKRLETEDFLSRLQKYRQRRQK